MSQHIREIVHGPIRFRVADVGFRVGDEGEYWDSFADGSWEPYTVDLLQRTIGPGMRMIDIGAWRGPVTLIAASLGAEVHAFEPDPRAFEGLAKNVEANDAALRARIHVHNRAVTPDGAPLRLFARYGFGDSGSSMLSRLQDTGASVEVASTTFDRFIADQGIDRIDFLKMDIEGGEFFTLPTMKAALERFRPVLYLSTHAPLLAEFMEKKRQGPGVVRRIRRSLGLDPLIRSRRAAAPLVRQLAELVSTYPFAYTRELVPVDRTELVPMMERGLIEFVFSHRDLLR